jgi:hypothetical protein
MRNLLPYETLDEAVLLLNEICRKNGLTGDYNVKHFLALATFGEIDLTVKLPENFRFRSKLELGKPPIVHANNPSWQVPKGLMNFFIQRGTAFKLSDESSTPLDSICYFTDDGTKVSYGAAAPFIHITINDLRISGVQFVRYVQRLLSQQSATENADTKDETSSPSGTSDAAQQDSSVSPSAREGEGEGEGEGEAPAPALANWKIRVQKEATAMFLRAYKANASPSVSSIKHDLARWCRENNVVTDTGIIPNENYLRMHVLSSRHWTKPDRPKYFPEQAEQAERTEQAGSEQREQQTTLHVSD